MTVPSSLAKMFLQHSAESVGLFDLFGPEHYLMRASVSSPPKLRCYILAPGNAAPPAHFYAENTIFQKGGKQGT